MDSAERPWNHPGFVDSRKLAWDGRGSTLRKVQLFSDVLFSWSTGAWAVLFPMYWMGLEAT